MDKVGLEIQVPQPEIQVSQRQNSIHELCESRGGRPGLFLDKAGFEIQVPQPATQYMNCVKVEVAVLGSSSLIVLRPVRVSVDVQQH